MEFKHISIYEEEKGKIDYYLHKDVYRIFLKYKVEYAKIMYEYEKKLDSKPFETLSKCGTERIYNAKSLTQSNALADQSETRLREVSAFSMLSLQRSCLATRAITFFQSREQLYDKFGLELAYYIDADSYCWDAMLKNEDENYEFRIRHNNKIFLCKK
jgi:hypothetical protein